MLSSILIEIHCSTQPKNIFFTNQSVQSLSRVRLPVTRWTAARQASLSIISSWSLLKLMSIELTMPSYHLILSSPSPAISFFQHQSLFKWVSSSHQVTKVSEFQVQLSKGLSRVFSNITVQKHLFFDAQLSLLSRSHIHKWLLEKKKHSFD